MKLSEINIYPVKSLTGFSLEQSVVERQGLAKDRLLMLVDKNGLFITQRKHHRLALVSTQINDNVITVKAPDCSNLHLKQSSFTLTSQLVTLWKDECYVLVANEKINQWFSNYLKIEVKLVKYVKEHPRQSDHRYSSKNDIVSFADGYPLLVISRASLDDLNLKLTQQSKPTVTLSHFRANIIVDGSDAFAEDDWKVIKIGDVIFDAVKPCSRCILTTIDPTTGEKNMEREPLNTLAQYRKVAGGVMFGMNLIPRREGVITLNDKVFILEQQP